MQRYPLSWPQGWKRTAPSQRTRALFKSTSRQYSTTGSGSRLRKTELSIAASTARVLDELRRFGVLEGDAIISTNLVVRLGGLPRSDQRAPEDPGVAVYWERPGEQGTKCMAIDRYDRVADNLAAIAATLDAMRAIERHGGAQILARAFQGFDALPAPGQTSGRGWRVILGFEDEGAGLTLKDVEAAYRRRRSETHPDKAGGNADEFGAVQRAWEQAQQELRG